jgi:hypothetical protein
MDFRFVRLHGRGMVALGLLMGAAIGPAHGDSGRQPYPDSLNPQAQVPATTYRSPLADYRRIGEDKRVPWSEANQTVNRIGGWRTYAREADAPEVVAPASGAPGQAAPAGDGAPAHHRYTHP